MFMDSYMEIHAYLFFVQNTSTAKASNIGEPLGAFCLNLVVMMIMIIILKGV